MTKKKSKGQEDIDNSIDFVKKFRTKIMKKFKITRDEASKYINEAAEHNVRNETMAVNFIAGFIKRDRHKTIKEAK